MQYFIGLILSLAVADLAIVVGFDHVRAFYPTVVIASYYLCIVRRDGSFQALTKH